MYSTTTEKCGSTLRKEYSLWSNPVDLNTDIDNDNNNVIYKEGIALLIFKEFVNLVVWYLRLNPWPLRISAVSQIG